MIVGEKCDQAGKMYGLCGSFTICDRCGCIYIFASFYAMHALLILNDVGKIDPYWL